MPEYLLVADQDAERRSLCVASGIARMARLTNLTPRRLETSFFSALVAAGARAPLTMLAGEFSAALVLGSLHRPGDPDSLSAGGLLAASNGGPLPRLDADGFGLAVCADARHGLVVEADVGGTIPVYYWSGSGVTLVASSPYLIAAAAGFRAKADRQGLAGLLLTNGLVGGRTLWAGVARLEDNARLLAAPGKAPRAEVSLAIPPSERGHGLSFPEQVDLIGHEVGEALRRGTADQVPVGLMLSGGLDSRVLAGYLHALERPVEAITFGQPDDVEMQCATRVARALGFRHARVEPAPRQSPVESVRARVRRDHLASGLFDAAGSDRAAALAGLPPRTVCGYGFDLVVSPVPVFSGGWERSRDRAFQALFQRLNRWGLPPEAVARLLGSREPVDAALGDLRAHFDRQPGWPADAAWRTHIGTRGRFFISSAPWNLADGSWPVLPVLDRTLLATVGGMPQSTLGERKAEMELVRRRFPRLAALPLDRNRPDASPLLPTLKYQLWQSILRKVRPAGSHKAWVHRLPYYRASDFNGTAWKAVRSEADRHRDAVEGLLDRAILDELLPPAGQLAEFKDGIFDASGPKLLVGMILWSAEFR